MDKFIFNIIDKTDGTSYRLKHCPDGWRDHGISFGRESNVSNVVKSYSGAWSFIKEDGDHIWGKFVKFGPNRMLAIDILYLEDALSGKYRLEYSGYLDLTQIERIGRIVSVPVSEGGFFKLLENRWTEDYSYPFDEFLKVNGNVFSETARFTSPDCANGQIALGQNSQFGYVLAGGKISNEGKLTPVFFKDSNILHLFGDANNVYADISEGNASFVTKNRVVQKLSLDWDLILNYYIDGLEIENTTRKLESTSTFYMVSCPCGDEINFSWNDPTQKWTKIETSVTVSDIKERSSVVIRPHFNGSKEFDLFELSSASAERYAIFFVIMVRYGRQIGRNPNEQFPPALNFPGGNYSVRFSRFEVNMSYEQRINSDRFVCATHASTVFKSLIGSVNENICQVDVDTSDFERVAGDDMITSVGGFSRKIMINGHSRRYAPAGVITTNLDEFLKYCYSVYGYKLGVDYDMGTGRYRVFLAHSDNMYDKDTMLSITRTSEVGLSVWRDVLYSSVSIGYEKDVNAINGDRDFNCMYTLSTPNTGIERNELQLICPYSASTRSFETELYKTEEFKSGELTGDVRYLLSAKYSYTDASGVDVFELSRDIPVESGSMFPDEEYNVKFSPKRMIDRHGVELNGYFAFEVGKPLIVETCDGNSSLVAAGIAETFSDSSQKKAMYTIGVSRKFKPIIISFSSIGDSSVISRISSNRTGCVKVLYDGKTYVGYLAHTANAVTVHPMDEKECQYVLLMSEESDFD